MHVFLTLVTNARSRYVQLQSVVGQLGYSGQVRNTYMSLPNRQVVVHHCSAYVPGMRFDT